MILLGKEKKDLGNSHRLVPKILYLDFLPLDEEVQVTLVQVLKIGLF